MRVFRSALLAGLLTASLGAAAPAGEMPPHTVRLSSVMQEMSSRPGFTEAFLAQVEGGSRKSGAALLTPALVDHLRKLILGKDWQGLDRFPGWTMREINPTVRVVGHLAGKQDKVQGMATAGGAPSGASSAPAGIVAVGDSGSTGPARGALAYLELDEFGLERGGVVNLDAPAQGKGFDSADYVTTVGDGLLRGDGPNGLAPLHAQSARLAALLNRLSMHGFDGAVPLQAMVAGRSASRPEELIAALLQTGHTVEVSDSRYFANFGHLHYHGQDVLMPFWINSQILLPGTMQPLLVPVSHAEYEWLVRGPKVNAAVSFYFGIDGKAEFRTMDQLDQAWVMNRHAHEYRGADAVEVTRLSGEMVQAYERLHQAHPAIPFGGYYGFGVCQDVVAAIELKMTGTPTLFPNTADNRFFTDARDAEVNDLIKRLPKDRIGRLPDVNRIFGSLPVGRSDAELATISIPNLGQQLIAVSHAWDDGTLKRTREGFRLRLRLVFAGIGLLLASAFVALLSLSRRRGPA